MDDLFPFHLDMKGEGLYKEGFTSSFAQEQKLNIGSCYEDKLFPPTYISLDTIFHLLISHLVYISYDTSLSRSMQGASSNCEGDSCEVLIKDIKEMIKKSGATHIAMIVPYLVPNNFCTLNEEAYTSMVVSVGNFHYGEKKELQLMENFKLRCVEKVRQ